MQGTDHDLVIIGGGAAGLTAGIYACRYGLDTILLERLMTGGQIINAERIENFPGFPDGVAGAEIGPLMQDQAMQQGLDIQLAEVIGLRRRGPGWLVETVGRRAGVQGRDRCGRLDPAHPGRTGRGGAPRSRRLLLRHLRRGFLHGPDCRRRGRRRLGAGRGPDPHGVRVQGRRPHAGRGAQRTAGAPGPGRRQRRRRGAR